MTALLDASRVQVLLGSYGVAKAQALADPFVALKTQEYRRTLASRMKALAKEDAAKELPVCDYFVSRKVDGEFCTLLIDGKNCCTVNPGSVVRVGLPFMEEACSLLSKSNHKTLLVAGELYVDRPDRRPRVHDVSRIARLPTSQAEVDSLRFAVFDILEIDGKPAPKLYTEVFKQIQAIFKNGKTIDAVETVKAKNADEVLKQFDKWVDGEGAEGIVVRSDSAGQFKIKPKLTIDAAVLGFTEGTDDRTGMLHDVLLGLMRNDGGLHVLGRVGTGFNDDQRREYLSDLKDMTADSDYAEANDGVAYTMVKPQWVVEVSCLDLVSQNTRGATVDRMVLNYDSPKNIYHSIRRLPLASPISPVFKRKREDKSIKQMDLRIAQVGDVVDVPMLDQDARKLVMPRSELLRREVFTKTLKGNLMVRKLLLWKTNKESELGKYPAYVAYYTDFSPSRATPLDRDIRVSNSREQIEQLWAELKTEYVVKGWAPAAG